MAARAMWKGVIGIGEERVPVKLYAAVKDQKVHFRLLHEEDGVPVQQRLVDPETLELEAYTATQRAYVTPEHDLVILNDEELASLEPPPSRDIGVSRFVPTGAIDHRLYDRPYYLGPDDGGNGGGDYAALAAALAQSRREGIAHWVMRKKEYRGALRARDGYLMLVTLRPVEETIAAGELAAPAGKPLDEREIAMAQQLLSLLESRFEPEQYRDEYRQRVLELVEAKAKGKTIRRRVARRPPPAEDLTKALEASLAAERKRA